MLLTILNLKEYNKEYSNTKNSIGITNNLYYFLVIIYIYIYIYDTTFY